MTTDVSSLHVYDVHDASPMTPVELAEVRRVDALFDADNPYDYARPDWLVGLLVERRKLLATLDAALSEPVRASYVSESKRRRHEVAEMIEEADRQDDTPAGPDALLDALMEIAEGWCREGLDVAQERIRAQLRSMPSTVEYVQLAIADVNIVLRAAALSEPVR